MSGEFDFFSVASTTPFVAGVCVSGLERSQAAADGIAATAGRMGGLTFDSERGHSLVDSIEGVFWSFRSAPFIFQATPPSPASFLR